MRTFYLGLAALGMLVLMTTEKAWAADPNHAGAVGAPVAPVDNATAIAQAAERARQSEVRKDMPGLVAALNDEADGHLRAHEFDDAEKILERILRLQEEHAGRESLPVADALLNLGWFYSNMARYEKAQGALDRCMEIRRRLLGQDAAPVGEALNALAVLEENRSNLTLAEAFYLQAIEIQEKTLGSQSPVTATTWNNLATLYWITSDYEQAGKYFSQALAVREKTLGPNSLGVATTLNNLALLDSSLGDYDEAESYFQRALKIRTGRLGPDHPFTITTLFQLGLLYVREGNDARAEPLLVRTAEARQKIYRQDHPDVARSYFQLGLLYDRRKQYEKAEPLLKQAMEIRRRTLGTTHPEYGASVAALAQHDHELGKQAEALPLYELALKIDGDALGQNHPDTLAIATGLAYLKLEMGQQADAVTLTREVTDAQQNALNGVFAFAPERQRMNFERTIEPCDLPAALGDPDLLAQVVLRTKGVVLDSLLEDEAVSRATRDPEVKEMLEKRRLLTARLLREQEDVSGAESSPAAEADRKELAQEVQELEASLANKGVGSGKTRRALATDVSDVQEALPPDAALVEYVAYNRYQGRLGFEPAYGAVVLTRGAPCRWVSLGSVAEINEQVQTYQKYMRKRVRDAALSEVLHGLYRKLCQPVATGLPAGVHRLIVSPDGELNLVSFVTLLDEGDHFLGEDFDVSYVASGRDLLQKHIDLPRRKRLVVFANPDYTHVTGDAVKPKARGAGDGGPFTPLPGSEREATFLLQAAKSNGLDVVICRGSEASKANLALQDSPYVLHLATHGLYLSEDDMAHLPVGDGDKNPAGESMMRSLLAFAGASVTLRQWKQGVFPPPDDDGLLTAQEAAGLNLDHTWLVTLSACDTGNGEVRAGEGVLGLRRGFAEAGAQNLLVTLWTVDDAETADLMETFYREALRTGDAPGALASVQRASLEDIRKKSGLCEAVRKAGPFILSY